MRQQRSMRRRLQQFSGSVGRNAWPADALCVKTKLFSAVTVARPSCFPAGTSGCVAITTLKMFLLPRPRRLWSESSRRRLPKACAVELAEERARPGDTVLLAPACAGFDKFKSYQDGGRLFKQLGRNLAKNNAAAEPAGRI